LGVKAEFSTTSSFDARTASRRAVPAGVFILCRAAKNEPRKRAKGFQTLWRLSSATSWGVPRSGIQKPHSLRVPQAQCKRGQEKPQKNLQKSPQKSENNR